MFYGNKKAKAFANRELYVANKMIDPENSWDFVDKKLLET
jgi:hypothetical protein